MATRRVPPSTPTPAELSHSTRTNGPRPARPTGGEDSTDGSRPPGWIREHPDSDLGDLIDVMRVHLLTLIELERWSPSAPQPGVDISPPRYLSDLGN